MRLTMRSVHHWVSQYEPNPRFYYFADGSPASGFEAYIVVEQYEGQLERWNRLCPMVFLGFGWTGLTAKVYALLWKIFLEIGPDVPALRWKLRHTRGFITDQGTEADLADCSDVLPDFLRWIGFNGEIPPPEDFLFPLALWSCGWHHKFDNIALEVDCINYLIVSCVA